jgi:hypothetical protein
LAAPAAVTHAGDRLSEEPAELPHSDAVTFLSRNDGAFPLILSETTRKTGAFRPSAPAALP